MKALQYIPRGCLRVSVAQPGSSVRLKSERPLVQIQSGTPFLCIELLIIYFIIKITMEERIKQICLKKALAKLSNFAKLEENWFDPEMKHGETFSQEWIDKCKEFIKNNFDVSPEVFPLCDGDIQIEWTTEPGVVCEIELRRNKDLNKLFVFVADMRDDKNAKFYQIVNATPIQVNEMINKAIKKEFDFTTLDVYINEAEENY